MQEDKTIKKEYKNMEFQNNKKTSALAKVQYTRYTDMVPIASASSGGYGEYPQSSTDSPELPTYIDTKYGLDALCHLKFSTHISMAVC